MICFAWAEFPQYAARCVGAFVRACPDEKVVVIATRPRVPIAGMDALAGCPVHWIDETDTRSVDAIVGEMPRVIFVSGWGTPLFNRYRDAVRAAGGKAIAMSDNNFRFSLREIVKAIRFRLLIRPKYDGYFVAGKSCVKLLRFYGVPESQIKIGMYAADNTIFHALSDDICSRPKKVIYVGQFIERKNVRRLCQAFAAANVNGDWTLELYGSGPLRDEFNQTIKQSNNQTIHLHDFLQPEQLAEKYRESRIFCLPSLEEHWGLVVHEAALSGCVLLLSEGVGAGADFMGRTNGFTFDPRNIVSVAEAFRRAFSLSDDEFENAQRESLSLAQKSSLSQFLIVVGEFCSL